MGAAADAPPAEPAAPEAQPAPRLEAELAQMRERWARARADYENLQKRVERDAALERERARARVLEGFLPVFELAQIASRQAAEAASAAATRAGAAPAGEMDADAAAAADDQAQALAAVAEGVRMMEREFARLLEREGLVQVGQPGEPFDPRRHDAVGHEPAPGAAPGTVARVVQPGYRLGDRLLRTAKVVVVAATSQG